MSPSRPEYSLLARAMLVAVVLAAVLQSPGAQGAMGVAAVGDWERRSAQAQRVLHRRAEQNLRMEREQAHAQMPDTMYASTPDPAPPHPFLLEVGTESTTERSAGVPARAAERLGYRVGRFPAASRWTQENGYQGFVRVINRSDDDGEVRIDAWDDAGEHAGAVALAIEAHETKHFNSEDLEEGNAGKGLSGGIGSGEGDWRLELSGGLDIEVLGYIRTTDGFLTAMHDVAPSGEAGHEVVTFNPGRNDKQVSRLRVVNPGAEDAEVRIEGIDDDGKSSHGAVEFTLALGASRTLGARELESGEAQGVSGALGTGEGKWRLLVTSKQPIEVMSLLYSPTGHLTNLSTVPDNAEAGADGAETTHGVGLFPSASDALGRQGFVRVVNRSESDGEVRIDAWDKEGTPYGPVTLAIGAGETKHFNSGDLEMGNAGKGLKGATGSGKGDWRLELTSTLELQVPAYIRTEDGFLTAMHDVAPSTESGYRVVTFNPGKNADQVSRLRLVNPGDETAEVTIEGVDDKGASPGGAVVFSLAAGASRTLTAKELESGEAEGLSGALGTGTGKWRLTVTADRPIEVMSLLSSPTGHLTNLSTVRGKVVVQGGGETAAEVFREHISGPIVQGKCIVCHVEGGIAGPGTTRLQFVRRASDPNHEALNLGAFEEFIAKVDDGANVILDKIRGGRGHGGGTPVPAGTPEFAHMERFLGLLGEDVTPVTLTPQTLFDTVRMAPLRKTLRRAALIFAGRIPTDEEYAAVQRGGTEARETIRALMTGPQFHEFLIRASNDRLLTDREDFGIIDRVNFVEFTREKYRRSKAAYESGNDLALWQWYIRVQHGARRAPLELIAHVAENDLPYTEILTADYIMANPPAAAAYGAPTHHFEDPTDFDEFRPSSIEAYYREGEDFEVEYDPVIEADLIVNPGTLSTAYPHAGILNTTMFLRRYPTTATNRNRARSRWTYYHFLGLDIEKSASRTTDPDALADTNNPTMSNPACTVCHLVLDPVAGAFQNYGDEGFYKDKWGGMDSLDDFYKRPTEEIFEIEASSWAERQTFSTRVWLPRDGRFVLRHVNNNYCDDDGRCGTLGRDFRLDEIAVRDAGSGALVQRVEWAVLDEYCLYDGRYNRGVGATDHYQWWGWECEIPLVLPADNTYAIEVVAWADRAGDELAKLAIGATLYREGDTWYRDMRVPGFGGEVAPDSDNSAQWLAQRIVADERFPEATVKFWWPAIMGSEVAEPPEDEEDADFEGLLLAANAQGAEVTRLARGFRWGFRGGSAYHLKDLLVEIVLSKWFRADALEDADSVRSVALRDAGARRLLTPEELARKTAAVTGVQWGRGLSQEPWDGRWPSALTEEYRLLYGGIDSDGITERSRDVTSVMAGVARAHATQMSCPIVMRELFLLPDSERLLFAGIDRAVTPVTEFSASFDIKSRSPSRRETHSVSGSLTAGPKNVRLSYNNDYWGGESADRNLYLDRLVVRGAAGRVVARHELERLASSGDCNGPSGDHFAMWCSGSVEVSIDIPVSGTYEIEIVASAEQAGDEYPRLEVTVESDSQDSAGANAIRSKLVELHEKLLGVRVTPHSPDVEAAFRLFVEVWERKRSQDTEADFQSLECDWWRDIRFWNGTLDDALVEYENEDGGGWYEYDWDRVNEFMDGIDWSDHHYTAQTWMVVLAYLMMDYRYLNL